MIHMTTSKAHEASRRVFIIYLLAFFSYAAAAPAQPADSTAALHPFQISFVPGLSTLGPESAQAITRFSFNIVGGHTGGVSGLEVAGAFNINEQDVSRAQFAGAFNWVKRDVSGVQAAGAANVVGNVMAGVQMAGALNRAGKVKGAQLAGAINIANAVHGAQLAGAVNVARGETGTQVAGAINVGGHVRGAQLAGLLNIADSSDYPIGLINLIKNGTKSVAIQLDETRTASVVFRSGGRVMYGVLGLGYRFGDDAYRYALEGGIGARFVQHNRFSLNIEAVHRTMTDFETYTHMASLKVLPAYRFGNHLELFGGPTANVIHADDSGVEVDAPGWVWYRHRGDRDVRSLHGGLIGGVRYVW